MSYFSWDIRFLSQRERINAISSIPHGTTTLWLIFHPFWHRRNAEELAELFADLPESITTLNLYECGLDEMSGVELATAFRGIKKNITHLSLGNNLLFKKKSAELKSIFSGLEGKSITHLDLSRNYLGARKRKQTIEAFSSIPKTVIHLNLSEDDIELKQSAAPLLAGTPDGVSELDLTGTNFDFLKDKRVFGTILPQVHTIILTFEAIEYLLLEERKRLKKIVPNIKNIIFMNSEGDMFDGKIAEAISLQKTFGIQKIPSLYDLSLFKVSNYVADKLIPIGEVVKLPGNVYNQLYADKINSVVKRVVKEEASEILDVILSDNYRDILRQGIIQNDNDIFDKVPDKIYNQLYAGKINNLIRDMLKEEACKILDKSFFNGYLHNVRQRIIHYKSRQNNINWLIVAVANKLFSELDTAKIKLLGLNIFNENKWDVFWASCRNALENAQNILDEFGVWNLFIQLTGERDPSYFLIDTEDNGVKEEDLSDLNRVISEMQRHAVIELLDAYLLKRAAITDCEHQVKHYYYGNFFAVFQKSYTEKCDAVHALKAALNGEEVDLLIHLPTLRNGNLGKELRAFIKAGFVDDVFDTPIRTVSDFIIKLDYEVNHNDAMNVTPNALA